MDVVAAVCDVAAGVCLLGAVVLSVSAGVGLLRFRDALGRLHAATKPQVFGLLLVLVALALSQRSWGLLLVLLPVFALQALTAPVAAHMIARAAYRSGQLPQDGLAFDELAPAIAAADAEKSER